MLQRVKRHRILISRISGVILIIAAVAAYFWNRSDGVSEEVRRAEANLARMESRLQSGAKSSATQPSQSVAEAYYESRKEHLRYALILAAAAGTMLILYGWIGQKRDEDER
ncbi:MAG: hypothetical protein JXK05_04750 [Campylobacterales bacterium]|nr:hypothetical protein [Campylobacterales bacterium]